MKVTMNTTAAGPTGILHLGKTYSVPDEFGKALVDGKFALAAEPTEKVVEIQKPEEPAAKA